MKTILFNYIPKDSPVHRLTGATKLAALLLLSFASMTTFDTRFLLVVVVAAFSMFFVSKIRFREVKTLLWLTFIFMVLNNILIYLFEPEQGVMIYGTRHVLFTIVGRYTVTAEQLFYHLNVILKYLSMVPLVILFVSTTNPSEFAASLNRIGVNYKICYSVSLALRYIPDVQREFKDISDALHARGVEMTSKEKFTKRLRNVATILFPLIMTSMQKIEVVSNAMELRSFGKNKKRTWYVANPFQKSDIVVFVICGVFLAVSILLNLVNHGRYYNPFI